MSAPRIALVLLTLSLIAAAFLLRTRSHSPAATLPPPTLAPATPTPPTPIGTALRKTGLTIPDATHLVIVVDVSVGMHDPVSHRLFPAVRQAMSEVLQLASNVPSFKLVDNTGATINLQRWTPNTAEDRDEAINALRSYGKDPPGDVLDGILTALDARSDSTKPLLIYVISAEIDSDAETWKSKLTRANLAAPGKPPAIINTIKIPVTAFSAENAAAFDSLMQSLATETNGNFLPIDPVTFDLANKK